jgi:hypothetical protein
MTHPVTTRRAVLGGTAVLCCLLVAACGGAGPEASPARASAAGHANADYGPASLAVPGTAGTNSAGAGAATGSKTAETAGLMPTGESIIYTASLTVRSADVAAAAKRAVAVATAAGGYVADEQAVSGTPGKSGGTVDLTLKIPVPSYQDALAQLSSPAIGKQLALQQQATDVTQQVADVNSLVTSQQDAIAALQGLLKHAGSVSGLLQVQQQISNDESNLNSLLAEQRALDHETTYATVSMTLVSPRTPARHHHKAATRRGFLAGLGAGWRALRHAVAWLATALGAALPFLIVVLVLAGIGYGSRRRILRRRAAGPTA